MVQNGSTRRGCPGTLVFRPSVQLQLYDPSGTRMQEASLFQMYQTLGKEMTPPVRTLGKVGKYDHSPRCFCKQSLVVTCHEYWLYNFIKDTNSPRVFIDEALRR